MYRAWLHPRMWAGLAGLTRCSSSGAAEPFLSGSSGVYVEQMYEAWRENPSSVHKVECVYVCVCVYTYMFHSSPPHVHVYILNVNDDYILHLQKCMCIHSRSSFVIIQCAVCAVGTAWE